MNITKLQHSISNESTTYPSDEVAHNGCVLTGGHASLALEGSQTYYKYSLIAEHLNDALDNIVVSSSLRFFEIPMLLDKPSMFIESLELAQVRH